MVGVPLACIQAIEGLKDLMQRGMRILEDIQAESLLVKPAWAMSVFMVSDAFPGGSEDVDEACKDLEASDETSSVPQSADKAVPEAIGET